MKSTPRHILFQADALRHAMSEGWIPEWKDITDEEKGAWVRRAIRMREKYNEKLLDGKRYVA